MPHDAVLVAGEAAAIRRSESSKGPMWPIGRHAAKLAPRARAADAGPNPCARAQATVLHSNAGDGIRTRDTCFTRAVL